MSEEKKSFPKFLEYFENNEFAASTFLNKYPLRDKQQNIIEDSPDQSIFRVMDVLGNSLPPPSEECLKRIFGDEYKPYMSDKRWTWTDIFVRACNKFKGVCPQGSVLCAAGDMDNPQSLSNCFVIDSPRDDINDIFRAGLDEANLMRRRGGVGMDLSLLRPAGTTVKNAARTSSGVYGWMNFFSDVCRDIGQNGRRGALMLSLLVKHPDAALFATAKNDKKYCTGANISLRLTNEFMKAVVEDKEFVQQFPVDSLNPTVKTTVKARDLWKTICDSAHFRAEPGLIFWDNALDNLPAHCYDAFKAISTNPSLRAGTKVLTSKGIFSIEDLQDTSFYIKNLKGEWSSAKCFLSGKNKKLIKLTLEGGHTYYATAEHKWPVYNPIIKSYTKVATEDLSAGLYLPVNKHKELYENNNGTWDEGFLIGCNLGDGWQTIRKDTNKLQVGFCCSTKSVGDRTVLKELNRIINSLGIDNSFTKRDSTYEININNKIIRDLFIKFEVNSKSKGLPNSIWFNTSEQFRLGLLNGLISTDGYARGNNKKGNRSLQLTTAHKQLAEDFSALLGFYGIKSSIKYSKTTKASFPNGKDYNTTYERYDIVIADALSLTHLKSLIPSFINLSKNDAFYNLDCKYTQYHDKILITKVENTELTEDVWDIQVNDSTHCFQLSHCVTGNCSEIVLSANDSCRLITICLINYVLNAFTKDAEFDFVKFEQDVRVAMRMMDALVTAEIASIDRIIEKITKDYNDPAVTGDKDRFLREIELWKKIRQAGVDGRRCGLGTHGLGDCLAQLQLKYDSDEALAMVEKIYKKLRDIAYDESVEMAIEYGPFPAFDWEKEKDCAFIKRLPKQLRERIKLHGRRNISLLTNAPTGTLSIVSQVSSGIEPVFRYMYTRRRKVNASDLNSRVDFVDELGDKWMNFPQFEKNIERYFKATGKELPQNVKNDEELQALLPNYFVTSDKINWKRRVEIQGVIQQYIDHSISSTINLPSDVKASVIADLYELAWSKGLKGLTVYRQGCRDDILIANDTEGQTSKTDEGLSRKEAPKRPDKLPCDVYVTSVKGTEYVVIVGLLNNSVYELFAGEYNNQIPKKPFSGFVEKKGKSKYILNYIEDVEFKQVDVNKYFDNKDYATATRLLSMSLRHGCPLGYIIDQLQKAGFSLFDFGPAVARILKKYVKVEDMKKVYNKCNKCGSKDVILTMESGCYTLKCNSCNTVDSKCS
jgi:ribonucleotide reductase alpha subunit